MDEETLLYFTKKRELKENTTSKAITENILNRNSLKWSNYTLQWIIFFLGAFCIFFIDLQFVIPFLEDLYQNNLGLYAIGSTIAVVIQGGLLGVLIRVSSLVVN